MLLTILLLALNPTSAKAAPLTEEAASIVNAAENEFGADPWTDDEVASEPDGDTGAPGKVAAEPVPYKVLGRGLRDRRTDESLQIACVGAPETEGGEYTCRNLQFLYTSAGGVARLIGPVMEVKDDADGLTRKEIRRTLRAHGLAPPQIPGNRKFQFSQAIYLGKSTSGVAISGEPVTSLIFLGSMWGIGRALPAIWFNGGITITGAAGFLWPIPFIALPVIVDLVLLPFQIHKVRAEFGYLFGDLGKKTTVKALKDRATVAWQLKPHGVSHRGFTRFLDAISEAR